MAERGRNQWPDKPKYASVELTDASYSKNTLAEALEEVLKEFSEAKDHAQLPSLQRFINRYPDHSTIESWLPTRSVQQHQTGTPQKTKDRKLTKNRVIEEIQRRFSHAKINKIIS